MEANLVEAFQHGPETVWDEVRRILDMARGLVVDAAKDRFNANFGSPRCRSCKGLHAGPDVLATCLQLRQCNFSNLLVSDTSTKQMRVIESILGESKVA